MTDRRAFGLSCHLLCLRPRPWRAETRSQPTPTTTLRRGRNQRCSGRGRRRPGSAADLLKSSWRGSWVPVPRARFRATPRSCRSRLRRSFSSPQRATAWSAASVCRSRRRTCGRRRLTTTRETPPPTLFCFLTNAEQSRLRSPPGVWFVPPRGRWHGWGCWRGTPPGWQASPRCNPRTPSAAAGASASSQGGEDGLQPVSVQKRPLCLASCGERLSAWRLAPRWP